MIKNNESGLEMKQKVKGSNFIYRFFILFIRIIITFIMAIGIIIKTIYFLIKNLILSPVEYILNKEGEII